MIGIRPFRRTIATHLLLATAALVLAALAGPSGIGVGLAQSTDCNRLYAAIQAADGSARAARWDQAAQRQRDEIERTERYSTQLGCDQGGGASPQCGALTARLRHMNDNLAHLEAEADRASSTDDSDRRAAMLARYNAVCVGDGAQGSADLGLRAGQNYVSVEGQNPADMPDPDNLTTVPLNGDIMDDEPGARQNLGQAICVRTCDGGYFPLSPRAVQDQLGGLEQLCQASCPNTEARLYTMGQDGLPSASAIDGTPYTALPAAFKFEKTFSPTCTCKPPGQSWVEALAEAEKLLGNVGRHDVTVTAQLSDQMAKPGATPVPKGKGAKATRGQPAASLPDLSMMREGQKAAQAPTASTETSGIGGPVHSERLVPEGAGPTIEVKGADGVSRHVRLVGP